MITELKVTVRTDNALYAPFSEETHEIGYVQLEDGRKALTIRPKGVTTFSDWQELDLDTFIEIERSKNL